jgi:tight adherence protein B
MDGLFYVFAVLAFGAVVLMLEGLYLWWSGSHGSGAQRIARRLDLMATAARDTSERVSIIKRRHYSQVPLVDRVLHQIPLTGAIDRLLLQAGVKWSVAQFAMLSAILLGAGLGVIQLWTMPAFAALTILGLLLAFPYFLLMRARDARLRKLEQQLAEAVDFLARALRAGHSFTNVLSMAGTELPEPIGAEFRIVHGEISLGIPMPDALQNLATRVPLTDLRYLIIAVLIQRESGGNLAELLGNIARIVRERLKLLGQVRVLSAEGRLSAWILGLLPFVMMFVMSLANPEYISALWTDPAGIKLLWYGSGMLVLGALWLRKLVRIRV